MSRRRLFSQKVYLKLESFISCKFRERTCRSNPTAKGHLQKQPNCSHRQCRTAIIKNRVLKNASSKGKILVRTHACLTVKTAVLKSFVLRSYSTVQKLPPLLSCEMGLVCLKMFLVSLENH